MVRMVGVNSMVDIPAMSWEKPVPASSLVKHGLCELEGEKKNRSEIGESLRNLIYLDAFSGFSSGDCICAKIERAHQSPKTRTNFS